MLGFMILKVMPSGVFQDRLVEERRGFVASIDCAVGCRPA
jgi:uncharacterized protein YqkB